MRSRTERTVLTAIAIVVVAAAAAAWWTRDAWLPQAGPWSAIAKANTQEAFTALVDMLRSGGAMRNDDTTLVRIEVAA